MALCVKNELKAGDSTPGACLWSFNSCQDCSLNMTDLDSLSHDSSCLQARMMRGSIRPEAKSSRAMVAPKMASMLGDLDSEAKECNTETRSISRFGEEGDATVVSTVLNTSFGMSSCSDPSVPNKSGATCWTSERAAAELSAWTAAFKPMTRMPRAFCAQILENLGERCLKAVKPSCEPSSSNWPLWSSRSSSPMSASSSTKIVNDSLVRPQPP
mmetsp:Transcript_126023/g.352894  ORF Transcript_126023/g.352894 Transcript_126023/m.352894 type:complete len:214 (-) Transcript_126023:347-988(-)